MKRIASLIAAACLAALFAGCAGTAGSGASPIEGVEGKTVYTQRNLWAAGGEHEATNYRIGRMVPVNSKVRIKDTGGRTITATVLEDGDTFTIINVPEYTKKGMQAIYDRYFGPSPVDMSRFTAEERRAIESGRVKRGMSKDAVLIARGYPPAHETPSTDADQWRFWKGRHNTILVRFEDGRVASIKD